MCGVQTGFAPIKIIVNTLIFNMQNQNTERVGATTFKQVMSIKSGGNLPPRPPDKNVQTAFPDEEPERTGGPSGNQPGVGPQLFKRQGSTYTWKFFLTGNPGTREKALIGHSMPKDGFEPGNKQKLLEDILMRLKNRDYFQRYARMDIYRNFTDSQKDSDLFVTLYRNHYEVQPRYLNQTWLLDFLKNFFSSPTENYGTMADPFPTGGPKGNPQFVAPPTKPFPIKGFDNIIEHAKKFNPRNEQEYSKMLEHFLNRMDAGEIPFGQLQEWQRIVSEKLR